MEAPLTIDQVATALTISPWTARRLLTSGKLRGFRIGGRWRVLPSAIQDYIDRQSFVAARRSGVPTGAPLVTPSVRGLKGWDTFL